MPLPGKNTALLKNILIVNIQWSLTVNLVFEAFEKPLFLPSVNLNHIVIVTSVVAVA